MAKFQWDVAVRTETDGVCVEIVDYRWNAGDEIDDVAEEYILRWRTHPPFIEAPASLGTSSANGYGQLMFVPPNVHVHSEMPAALKRVRNVVCRFDPEWFERACPMGVDWREKDLRRCFDVRNPRLYHSMQRIGAEVISPGPGSSGMIDALSRTLAIDVARYFLMESDRLRMRTRNGALDQKQMDAIVERIESTEHAWPTIGSLANMCGISSAHLRRAFKNTTGGTVRQYLETVRIRKVKSLLRESDLPLKEISYRFGFADPSTFSSTFRRVTGLSPSDYRYQDRTASDVSEAARH